MFEIQQLYKRIRTITLYLKNAAMDMPMRITMAMTASEMKAITQSAILSLMKKEN